MPPLGLILAVGVTFGLAAQSCDVGGTAFSLDTLRDPITVTNASTDHDAYVYVSTSLGQRNFHLAPGGSHTVIALAATKYTLDVYAPADPSGATYTQALLDLRDKLETLSLHPENPSADAAGAIVQLSVVETALHQLDTFAPFQSCSGPIKTGVASQATITWSTSTLTGAGIWVLSCG
jgi:hypothetical protein